MDLANARLRDSEVLLNARRYDGAAYLCGYAVELRLKWRICKTLKWAGFPETSGEFEKCKSFRIHDLVQLLEFTGRARSLRKTTWQIGPT